MFAPNSAGPFASTGSLTVSFDNVFPCSLIHSPGCTRKKSDVRTRKSTKEEKLHVEQEPLINTVRFIEATNELKLRFHII